MVGKKQETGSSRSGGSAIARSRIISQPGEFLSDPLLSSTAVRNGREKNARKELDKLGYNCRTEPIWFSLPNRCEVVEMWF